MDDQVQMDHKKPDLTLAELGEQQLLKRLYRFCDPSMVGDDAAVLTPRSGHDIVVTTDMLVDGIHFSDRTTSPVDVGWRATAANLSDLAAMGATPLGITISLGLPGHLPISWLEQLYQGIANCLQVYGTSIIGGDTSRATSITVSMTALGEVLPEEKILRSTAQPGDVIIATGPHGAARAGLELLLHPELVTGLTTEDQAYLCTAHQRPRPRLDVIAALQQFSPRPRIAGMDSSDGLADAILQICRASQVGASIQQDSIPIPTTLQNSSVFSPQQVLQWSLYGGEDFELVLCLSLQVAHRLMDQLESATIIGQITPKKSIQLIGVDGREHPLEMQKSYQHFG